MKVGIRTFDVKYRHKNVTFSGRIEIDRESGKVVKTDITLNPLKGWHVDQIMAAPGVEATEVEWP